MDIRFTKIKKKKKTDGQESLDLRKIDLRNMDFMKNQHNPMKVRQQRVHPKTFIL